MLFVGKGTNIVCGNDVDILNLVAPFSTMFPHVQNLELHASLTSKNLAEQDTCVSMAAVKVPFLTTCFAHRIWFGTLC